MMILFLGSKKLQPFKSSKCVVNNVKQSKKRDEVLAGTKCKTRVAVAVAVAVTVTVVVVVVVFVWVG